MTYISSKAAVLGYGAVLSIGPTAAATGTPAYTPVGEVTDLTYPMSNRDIVKTTNFQSPGGSVEKLGVAIDWGLADFTYNYVPGDAGQTALLAANANNGVAYLFTLQLPIDAAAGQVTTGTLYSFHAIVKGAGGFDVSLDKVSQGKCQLDITGLPVILPGS